MSYRCHLCALLTPGPLSVCMHAVLYQQDASRYEPISGGHWHSALRALLTGPKRSRAINLMP